MSYSLQDFMLALPFDQKTAGHNWQRKHRSTAVTHRNGVQVIDEHIYDNQNIPLATDD
jgi:hypothetical protein